MNNSNPYQELLNQLFAAQEEVAANPLIMSNSDLRLLTEIIGRAFNRSEKYLKLSDRPSASLATQLTSAH